MSYFNHAFKKSFLMGDFVEKSKGKLGTTGNILAEGELAIVDAKTWEIQDTTYGSSDEPCNIIIANGPFYQKDKIGPFHGGYLESNKSKEINPKYVQSVYTVEANAPQNMIVNIGSTPYTIDQQTSSCCPDFMCGETYYLRIDIKGSPALRFLDHNAYLIVSAYTGCCAEGSIAPTPVDPSRVMIEWAKQIANSPLISPFVIPVVTSQRNGVKKYWYPTGVTVTESTAWTSGGTFDDWTEEAYTEGDCAGIVLVGAYVDTKFGDCTFQISDFYEKEPVRIYASEVDLNGDPCAFSSICVVNECLGLQANGLGETVQREIILSESYRQSFFATDFRIREITQGYDLTNAVDRTLFYDGLYLLHNVPRFNNPTSTFDNDRYLLQVFALAGDNGTPDGTINADISALNTWLTAWLTAYNNTACINSDAYEAETSCSPLLTATR